MPTNKRKAEEETETPAKKARTQSSDKGSTLFVGNLSWGVDDDMLFDQFKFCDGLASARVITDANTGRSRGFGYVDFHSSEAAEKALNEKQGSFIEGREIRIDFSGSKPNKDGASPVARAKKFGDVLSPESDTLFVGNLSFNTDEDTVSAFFSETCEVKSLRLPTEQ